MVWRQAQSPREEFWKSALRIMSCSFRSVVDIGCGGGDYFFVLQGHLHFYYGLEASPIPQGRVLEERPANNVVLIQICSRYRLRRWRLFLRPPRASAFLLWFGAKPNPQGKSSGRAPCE